MRRPKSRLDAALDGGSDFAIDCWLWAIRLVAIMAVSLVGATVTGGMSADRWAELPDKLQEMGLLVFGAAVLLAIAYRIDRALARQRRVRHSTPNGGQNTWKRARRRERARRKRSRQ